MDYYIYELKADEACLCHENEYLAEYILLVEC